MKARFKEKGVLQLKAGKTWPVQSTCASLREDGGRVGRGYVLPPASVVCLALRCTYADTLKCAKARRLLPNDTIPALKLCLLADGLRCTLRPGVARVRNIAISYLWYRACWVFHFLALLSRHFGRHSHDPASIKVTLGTIEDFQWKIPVMVANSPTAEATLTVTDTNMSIGTHVPVAYYRDTELPVLVGATTVWEYEQEERGEKSRERRA